jgi:nickel-dependent lactate racemase
VDEPYALVVTTGGGYPLDATYYQTVKGMVGALPASDDCSTLVVLSTCDEGVGSPEYERLMRRWATDWRGFLAAIRQTDHVEKDQWQLQMQIRALARLGSDRVRLACDGLSLETQRAMGVEPITGAGPAVTRCQRFIDQMLEARPDARVGLIPEGPYTLLKAPLSGA